MSRSYRKTRIAGHTLAQSDKEYKRAENRRYRRAVKDSLTTQDYENMPDEKEFGDPWNSMKEGKQWLRDDPEIDKWMRK